LNDVIGHIKASRFIVSFMLLYGARHSDKVKFPAEPINYY